MNKRIRELAEQVYGSAHYDDFKFAELIVRECLGDFKDRITRLYQGSDKDCDIAYDMVIVYMSIIDKFGVE